MASLVWNVATTSSEKTAGVLDEIFNRLDHCSVDLPEDVRDVVEALVESRRKEYAVDPRVVLRTEAFDVGGVRKIQVASGMGMPRTWPR